MINFFCYDEKIVSLKEMRDRAESLSVGDHYKEGEQVTIHIHKYGELCSKYKHEIYYTPEQKKDIEEFTKLTTKEDSK